MSGVKTRVADAMPRPWFHASNLNKPICEMMPRHAPRRPLVNGERLLGAFILPLFQRGSVWTQAQQIRLIESLWGGLPIGAYVYNQVLSPVSPCDGWLLDGQQRVTAILTYMAGEFPVHGWRYPDLPIHERRGFEFSPVSCLQTQIRGEAACREVYDRLAYGGTAHDR